MLVQTGRRRAGARLAPGFHRTGDPVGIYELTTNRGFVCVGDCFDIPRFAGEAINDWWQLEGCRQFPHATRLLILADAVLRLVAAVDTRLAP